MKAAQMISDKIHQELPSIYKHGIKCEADVEAFKSLIAKL
jgi:hypothetical protein